MYQTLQGLENWLQVMYQTLQGLENWLQVMYQTLQGLENWLQVKGASINIIQAAKRGIDYSIT